MIKYRVEILHVIRQVEYYEVEAESHEDAIRLTVPSGVPLGEPFDIELLHDEYGAPATFDVEAEAQFIADQQIGSEWGN